MSKRNLSPAEAEYRDAIEGQIKMALSALQIGDFAMVNAYLESAQEEIMYPPARPSI